MVRHMTWHGEDQGKERQHNATRYDALGKQSRAGQGRAGQGRAGQGRAGQSGAERSRAERSGAEQSKAERGKASRGRVGTRRKAKQKTARHNKNWIQKGENQHLTSAHLIKCVLQVRTLSISSASEFWEMQWQCYCTRHWLQQAVSMLHNKIILTCVSLCFALLCFDPCFYKFTQTVWIQ